MRPPAGAVGAAYVESCLAELRAPKAGNVHDFSDGHGMSVGDFETSANVTRDPIAMPGASVGERVLGAIRATRRAVGCNTNLGIVLLCAPLALAAEDAGSADGLEPALAKVLDGLDVGDAAQVFEAIVLAAPAGLGGSAEHDVRDPPLVTLGEAMASAAHRDRIAWNYVNRYGDVVRIGLPAYEAALLRWGDPLWATAAVHFAVMAAVPDTHISRAHGAEAGAAAQAEASRIRERLDAAGDPRSLMGDILELDRRLKARGHNPGTSADLTVATLFMEKLRRILRDGAGDD